MGAYAYFLKCSWNIDSLQLFVVVFYFRKFCGCILAVKTSFCALTKKVSLLWSATNHSPDISVLPTAIYCSTCLSNECPWISYSNLSKLPILENIWESNTFGTGSQYYCVFYLSKSLSLKPKFCINFVYLIYF